MRTFLLAAILLAANLGTSVYSQKNPYQSHPAQEFWAQHTNQTSAKPTQGAPYAAFLQRFTQVKKSGNTHNARFTPTWCYTLGNISIKNNGQFEYFKEQYSYSTVHSYTIAYNQVTASGDFVAEVRKGTASISPEDTLVIQMQEKVNGTWKNLSYYKGFYDQPAGMFRPVLVKEYKREATFRVSEEVVTYRYFYNHPEQWAYEILGEEEGVENGADFYLGIRIKRFQNGAYISHRSAQKGVWEDDEKMEVTMVGNRKESIHYMAWGPNLFMPISKVINKYNVQGQETEEIIQENMGDGEMTDMAKTLTFYQNGKISSQDSYIASSASAGTWYHTSNTVYTYDTQGKLLDKTENGFTFINTPLSPKSKETYTYYPAGGPHAHRLKDKTVTQANATGSWIPQNRTTYTYTPSEEYTSYFTEEYTQGAYQPSQRVTYQVDNYLLTGETTIDYADGQEHNVDERTYAYARCETVLSAKEETDAQIGVALVSYPNPTAGAATLKLELNKPTSVAVTVVSPVGKVVQALPAQNFKTGAQELALDLTALPAGVYLVQAQTSFGLKTCRIVKQ